ncbi:MAG: sulfurtransferase [Melioribacteraceae bacterium]|nr:sulfurtransferase [Melioribacteraceae bacterium]
MKSKNEKEYFNKEVLVTTDWLLQNLDKKEIRIVESNEDPLLYSTGHIPGAVQIDWTNDLNNQLVRDYIGKEDFEKLMSKNGISNDTTVVFYGDKSNWWACYAFWVFKLFGHTNAKIINGGRLKWEKEGKPLTREVIVYQESDYKSETRNDNDIRAFRDDVVFHIKNGMSLIDVRSPEEYTGKRLHMPEYPNEGALRGGHIPGALNVPWAKAVNDLDGTFKSADELEKLYLVENHLNSDDDLIVYCRIGERSSHTWFLLKYLLGFKNVKNYDGSWTEWGNSVGLPIQK